MDINDIIQRFARGDTLRSISIEHNISVDRIRTILKRHNAYQPRKKHKCELPTNEVIARYKNDESIESIGNLFGVSASPIVKILKKHGIRKPNWMKDTPYHLMEKMLDYDHFKTIYDDLITQNRLANHFDCGVDKIVSVLKHHDLPLNTAGMSKSLQKRKNAKYEINAITFEKLYKNEKKPLYKIAELFGISVAYLRTYFLDWNVDYIRDGYNTSEKFDYIKNNPIELKKLIKDVSVKDISSRFECGTDSIYLLLKKHNIPIPDRYKSQAEIDIVEFLKENNIDNIITNTRNVISPLELDIYVPSLNIAIEYCGVFWHSELFKSVDYHKHKLDECTKKGIRLITIFEDEWENKKDIVKSKLLSIFQQDDRNRVYARKCEISTTPTNIKEFFKLNHIQGYGKGSIFLSLTYENIDVAMMVFMKKGKGYYLNRYATSYNVVGGFSKLLSFFIKKYEFDTLVSFADLRWSVGDLYNKNGWELESTIKPDYHYVDGRIRRTHKFNYRHSTGLKRLPRYNMNLSEHENMVNHDIFRIYDCGKLRYTLKKAVES